MRKRSTVRGLGLHPLSHINKAADMVEEARRAREKVSLHMDKGNCVLAFQSLRKADSFLGKARSHAHSVLADPNALPGERYEAEKLEREIKRAENSLDISAGHFEYKCVIE